MNPGRFYVPSYMGMRNIPMAASNMMGMANSVPRGMGLFSRITNGIRSINWGGILNNANKTLNVVNQTIPLVRQAGPMFNNMRSMLKIARAFGSETANKRTNNNIRNNSINANNSNLNSNSDNENLVQKKEVSEDNAPNFFV